MENGEKNFIRTGKALSEGHLAPISTELPLLSDVFQLHGRGAKKTWGVEGNVNGNRPHIEM